MFTFLPPVYIKLYHMIFALFSCPGSAQSHLILCKAVMQVRLGDTHQVDTEFVFVYVSSENIQVILFLTLIKIKLVTSNHTYFTRKLPDEVETSHF